ncbi:nucleotide-binding protein [Citrobacter cronae]|uniref:nucleotide-binding protein n=1 Tax=Citrobacter TaxID=544 RepID=UPI002FC9F803
MNHNKDEIIEQLTELKRRLLTEVVEAYSTRGTEFGGNRYEALKRKTREVLDNYLPGESARFTQSLVSYSFTMRSRWQDAGSWFLDNSGGKYAAYIDSLIMDIDGGEYVLPKTEDTPNEEEVSTSTSQNNRVFIVHGHGEAVKERTARFVSKLGLEPIILHEQASRGKTIIEKLEHYTDVGFALVLYTEDDLGNTASEAEKGTLNSRARQNVVFEHGLLIGLLSRERVMPIVDGNVELPGDISGVVYINDSAWQLTVAKELKSAGYEIDLNDAFS